MLSDLTLSSHRLFASPLTRNDARTLFVFYSDTVAMQYRRNKALNSMEDAYEMIDQANALPNKLRLGIRRKSDNQLIGTLLLTQEGSTLEVGFSFGKNFWGRGYGHETIYMVEQALKNTPDINNLRAWCMNNNIASIKILEKANYQIVPQKEYPHSTLFSKAIK